MTTLRLYIVATPSRIEFGATNRAGKFFTLPGHSIKGGVNPRRVYSNSISPIEPDEVIALFPGPNLPQSKAANKLAFELLLCIRQPNCRLLLAADAKLIEDAEAIGHIIERQPITRRLHVAEHFAAKRGVTLGNSLECYVPRELWLAFLLPVPTEPLSMLTLDDIRAELDTDIN